MKKIIFNIKEFFLLAFTTKIEVNVLSIGYLVLCVVFLWDSFISFYNGSYIRGVIFFLLSLFIFSFQQIFCRKSDN